MKYRHTTETGEICAICKKPILMFWNDADEMNGRSQTTTTRNGQTVHYFECAGGKSLQQLNEERRRRS